MKFEWQRMAANIVKNGREGQRILQNEWKRMEENGREIN